MVHTSTDTTVRLARLVETLITLVAALSDRVDVLESEGLHDASADAPIRNKQIATAE